LVARTGTTPWGASTGPEAYRKLKELAPASHHALNEIWEDLAPKLRALLDSMKVKQTSIRIGYAEEFPAPMILWIGVMPASRRLWR